MPRTHEICYIHQYSGFFLILGPQGYQTEPGELKKVQLSLHYVGSQNTLTIRHILIYNSIIILARRNVAHDSVNSCCRGPSQRGQCAEFLAIDHCPTKAFPQLRGIAVLNDARRLAKQLSAATLVRESIKIEDRIVERFRFGVQPNRVGGMLDRKSYHFKEGGILIFSLDCPVSCVLRGVIIPELYRQPTALDKTNTETYYFECIDATTNLYPPDNAIQSVA